MRLRFSYFNGYRIGAPLYLEQLERIGIVAIGRAFKADLCVVRLALYQDASSSSIRIPDSIRKTRYGSE